MQPFPRAFPSPFPVAFPRGGGAVTADYIITNDAEFDAVLALSDVTLAGKTAAIAPGNYTSKTISAAPASTLTFTALNPGNKPVIDKLVLASAENVTFENLRLACSTWANADATAAAVLVTTGISSDIIFDGCDIWGNYQGAVGADVDVVNPLPEVACIYPQFDGSGVVTSLVIARSNVAGLMADGTHSLTFTATSGYSFSVAPVASMTVSGGVITGTTLTSGGSSTYTNAINGSTGILSKVITWTGQRKLIDWMPWGVRCSSPGGLENITVQNCTFKTVANAFKPSLVQGAITFTGNNLSRVYMDFFSTGVDSATTPPSILFTDNFCSMPFSALGDPGDPHADGFQLFMDDDGTNSTADWNDITIERNIFIDLGARGSMQGIFLSDAPNAVCYSNLRVVGNAVLSSQETNGLLICNPKDAYIRNNLVARYDPTNTTLNAAAVNMEVPALRDVPGTYYAGGNSLIGNNINEGLILNGYGLPQINSALEPNVALGRNGATIAYSAAFADHTAPRTTVAQIVAAYTPKVAYAGKGPFADTDYIDHVGKTTDRTLEPTFVQFLDLTGQTASSVITSNWTRAIGGPATRSISISGGEYRTADDASGTNATAWASTAGTLTIGKWVQMRLTSASAGGSTSATLTIGSDAYVWSVASASVSSFVAIDNGATAYSRSDVLSDETGNKKLVIAFRMKVDTLTAGANFVAEAAASGLRIWTPSTSAYRAQFFDSARAQLRPGTTAATATKTHIITLDFSNTSAGQGCYWATVEDGMMLTNSAGTGGTFDTRTTAGSGTDYGAYTFGIVGSLKLLGTTGRFGVFGEADGGGTLLDGVFEFLWVDWGGSGYTIPDITNSAVRNLWTPGSIGANGNGPTGAQPKLYWTATDLTQANSAGGIANLGSLSSRALIKQAGTYS